MTFDVNAPSQKHQLDTWVSTVRSQFIQVDCKPLCGDFSTQISQVTLGNFNVSTVVSSAIRYVRNSSSIRQDPRDEMQLTLMLSGALNIHQNDRHTQINAGEMVLYESTRPFELEWNQPYQAVTIKIPTSTIQATVPLISKITATKIPTQTGRSALMKSMLVSLSTLVGETTEDSLSGVESSLLDLLSVTLNTDVIGQSLASLGNQKLRDIQTWLLANLDDSELDVATIADKHAVSIRTLNRLFAQDNTTVKKWLLQKRLEHSYKQLTVGKMTRITDVAYTNGFKDLSHFSRVFSQAFGISPKALTLRNME